jgi:hypothetical protein
MEYARIPKREERHLILVDIENLAATASPTAKEVQDITDVLRDVLPGFDEAQRIIACSHHAAATVAFTFPSARRLWQSGPNGADLALLSVLENERVGDRFGRVTICSGDGIFAAIAAHLGGVGVDVTVVSLEGHLAARLQLAARDVVLLTPQGKQASTGSAS